MARCPAHRDRNPSLSIAEGRDGRVLLTCFAGCAVTAILGTMHLRMKDLFSSEPPSPEQRAVIDAQRERERLGGRQVGEAAADALRFEKHVEQLGAQLAQISDDDPRGVELTRQFDEACWAMHRSEVTYETMQQKQTARAMNASR